MVSTLEQPNGELAEVLAEKDRELAEKDTLIERLRRRVRLLEKALFGTRSERVLDSDGQLQFEEMLKELEALSAELERQEEEPPPPPAAQKASRERRPRRNLLELLPDDLRREEVTVEIPGEDRICPKTGLPMVAIGRDIVEKLAHKPGEYYVKRFIYVKYASPAAPLQGVTQAPGLDFAIPGGVYDESFIANVVVDKCAYHLPLYRQEERLRALGIEISRQTLSHLYMRAAEALGPLYELLKEDVLGREVIFTDDTPVKLQVKGKGKTVTGRMWVYVGGGTGPPYRIFDFTVDRSKRRPSEFLEGFRGYIHADAYQGYDNLFERDGITECACWMHVRRKFFEALDAPTELREEVLRLIRMLYRYERVLKDKPADVVVRVREKRTAGIIDRIFERTRQALTEGEILPGSSFAKAIGYMHNLGDALRTFLHDARIKPDNGASERALRPLAIGRKNWLFAGSKRGGDATGVLLSLIQSCRAMDIEPWTYLEDVLRRIGGHCADHLDELLPHNWQQARQEDA